MARNDPMQYQLTVGELRRILGDAADDVVVGLALPPSTPRADDFTLLLNAKATYTGGPMVRLQPTSASSAEHASSDPGSLTIGAAGNVMVPAILALEARGFSVTSHEREGSGWSARRGTLELVAEDPLLLLGLHAVVETRGRDWRASDDELADVFDRFALDSP